MLCTPGLHKLVVYMRIARAQLTVKDPALPSTAALDVTFLLFSAFLVFGPMQLGFALVRPACSGALYSFLQQQQLLLLGIT